MTFAELHLPQPQRKQHSLAAGLLRRQLLCYTPWTSPPIVFRRLVLMCRSAGTKAAQCLEPFGLLRPRASRIAQLGSAHHRTDTAQQLAHGKRTSKGLLGKTIGS